MTEQEAKTKWCPMVRAASNVTPLLRYGEPDPAKARHPDEACCIGSGCAMWRWQRRMLGDNPMVTVHPDGSSTTDTPRPEHGYCGLAGPQ